MIIISNDYNGFATRFADFLQNLNGNLDISILDNNTFAAKVCNVTNSPFATNPFTLFGKTTPIIYNKDIIESCQFTQSESDACLLHEIGHLIYKGEETGEDLEILCDKIAIKANMTLHLLSALIKMQNVLKVNLERRIEILYHNLYLFRPEWTCGRCNEKKQVAIMYNLIVGASFFFDSFSAIVIGEILKANRNEDINVIAISSKTGISIDSLCQFYIVLFQNGLLTTICPTKGSIDKYRQLVLETKTQQKSWVDKTTREKLPMEVTNAEQAYFSAVDDGRTICSCMFELTYRCSEMCIHCYNPGATRNSTEKSHRADQQELTLENYKDIIDDMYNHGLVKVCLSGGDPFSKEVTWELIDYLYTKGIVFDVFTNGQRILQEVKRLANYYPRLVGISIYSGIAKDHDAITRVPGSWEKSIKIVKALSKLAVPMNLKCCIMQPNIHSYYMVADLAKEYRAIPQFEINITESNDGDICAKQLRLTKEQLQVILRDNNLALYVGKEAPNYGGQKRDLSMCSCGAGGTGFCMSPNGDLRACPAFTQVYGNLSHQTVSKILSESSTLEIWRKAVVSDYTECGRHDYCDYCNLCAGINYSEHQDFRKPAESNCYMAKCRFNLAHKLMKHDESIEREDLIKLIRKLPINKIVLQRNYRENG